jgi:hypothetical protein
MKGISCLSEELLAPKEEYHVLVSYLVGKSVGQKWGKKLFQFCLQFLV